MEIKVVKWISAGKANKYKSIGWMGGFFQNGMRWKDYIEGFNKKGKQYVEAVRKDVIKKGIKLTGSEHQNNIAGTPLFNTKEVMSLSFRAWGDLMAAIWAEKENKDYCYMNFYC